MYRKLLEVWEYPIVNAGSVINCGKNHLAKLPACLISGGSGSLFENQSNYLFPGVSKILGVKISAPIEGAKTSAAPHGFSLFIDQPKSQTVVASSVPTEITDLVL